MKLFTYFRSSAAYRVRIALNLKGLDYEAVPKHFLRDGGEHRRPDFLALNPQGLIPVLEDQGQVISQSLAIIEYLEERHPEAPLLPAGAVKRAQVRAMAQLVACDIHPLNNLRVLQYLKGELGLDEQAVSRWYRHWIAEGFQALEVLADRHSDSGRFCYGDRVSLADLCLVPQLYNARRFEADLEPYPTLRRIGENLEAMEAFALAAPENQPDAA